MNTKTRFSCLFLVVSAVVMGGEACFSGEPQQASKYTEAMFKAAFENDSTAPDFILITIRPGRDSTPSVRCIEAPFLKGAIHTEFGIGYGEPEKIRRLALDCFSKTLTLTKPEAIANVKPRYSATQLAEARKILSQASDEQLKSYDFIQGLCGYKNTGEKPPLARDAVAHVLLERGISCVRGCIVSDLTPNPKRQK